jgi:hypothetical protein
MTVETERLRRMKATFEDASPGDAQIESAWRRFDDASVVVGPRAFPSTRWAWALAAVAVIVVVGVVWAQKRRTPRGHDVAALAPSAEQSPISADSSATVLSTSIAPPRIRSDEVPDSSSSLKPAGTARVVPSNGTPPSSDNPGDGVLDDGERKARRALEPRVWSGRGTIDEVRMLKAICRHQKDALCVERANQVLAEMLER